MELKEVIEKRKSVRHFKNEEVPVDILKEMVRRAGLAPSINNSQPWKYLAVTNNEVLKDMADTVHKKIEEMFPAGENDKKKTVRETVDRFSTFFGNAPALLVVLNKPYEAVVDSILEESEFNHDDINQLRNHPNIQSIGAAVENILLSAVDLGYGACWLTGLLVAKNELSEISVTKNLLVK